MYKNKESYRLREQPYGYQWKRVAGSGKRMGPGGEHAHTAVVKMDNQQGPTV